ncbi:ATP-dependent helicase [Clostridium sp. HBUAS56017]|uniref:ATP-dependent helicase n=1 Tax=Clostridium sp. HBUAS56017 TaxID=2571128 RepID=UPI0011776DE7|nr:ATP-dependent helicase [Clostridium sp. HBUAS56017]
MEQNREQKEVLKSVQENRITLVEAPPGTGKTFTAVSLSINYLKEFINNNLNKKVLILTFSKNARAQIIKQLEVLDDGCLKYDKFIEISNYHSFYQKYIWAYSNYLGLPYSISIISQSKRKSLIIKFLIENGVTNPTETQINWATDLLEGDFKTQNKKKLKEVEKIVDLKEDIINYIITLNKEGYIAFSDFGFYMKMLIEKSKSFLNILQNKYKLIVLDEYQDSSDIQDFVVKKLVGTNNKAVFFADSKQMIYEWRGAKGTRLSELKEYYGDEIKSLMLKEVFRYKNSSSLLDLIQNAREGIFVKDNLRNQQAIKIIDVLIDEKNINLYSPMIKNKCYSKMKYEVLKELKKYKGKTVGILSRRNDILEYLKEKFIVDFKINLNELSNNEEEHNFIVTICEFITTDEYGDVHKLTRFLLWLTFEVTYEKSFGKVKKNDIRGIIFDNIKNVRNEVVKKIKGYVESINDLESMKLSLVEYLKFVRAQDIAINNKMLNLAIKVIKTKDIDLEKATLLLLQYQYNNSFKDLKGEYILNIHQSKGREFDVVFLIDSESIKNEENLLYVALSRVKEEIVVFDWKSTV